MDLRDASVDELFQLARSSEDPDAYWACVTQLHGRGGERAFQLAEVLCDSILPGERCLGADVLGQIDGTASDGRETLRRLLDEDDQPAVLAAAAAGVGFLHDEDSVDRLLKLTSHREAGVRFAAVNALMRIDAERGIAALTELSVDGDPTTREWAASALRELRGA
jgi:HEAT repeat protein